MDARIIRGWTRGRGRDAASEGDMHASVTSDILPRLEALESKLEVIREEIVADLAASKRATLEAIAEALAELGELNREAEQNLKLARQAEDRTRRLIREAAEAQKNSVTENSEAYTDPAQQSLPLPPPWIPS